MKEEVNTILDYLECEGEMFLFRSQLLLLSASRAAELQQIIVSLLDVINQTNIQSHKHAGFYYLFLGCAYYEQDQYSRAVSSLKSAINEMWGAQENKAIAHWLLGFSYSNMQDFPKARNELQEALQLLATHKGINSLQAEKEHRSRQTIRQSIKFTLERLFNEPLFRVVQPDPIQSADRFPVQDPPTGENDAASISLDMPVSVINENHPAINIPVTVTNENQPVNKLSFNPLSPNTKSEQEHENTERDYETRTDDDGYLIIQSIPIYNEYVRAGKSGGVEPVISADKFAEFHHVNIEGTLYTIHSLRSNEKRVNVTQKTDWGWIKVKGKSMNKIKGNVSINEADYVLFQKNPNANNNDIVVAIHKEHRSIHVKRLRKFENMLYSETTEKGPEYAPIDIKDNNMEVIGIVYAVAKPIIP